MPDTISREMVEVVDQMVCTGVGEPAFVKNRNATSGMLRGAGSSLQGQLQTALANAWYTKVGSCVLWTMCVRALKLAARAASDNVDASEEL